MSITFPWSTLGERGSVHYVYRHLYILQDDVHFDLGRKRQAPMLKVDVMVLAAPHAGNDGTSEKLEESL